MNIQEGISKVSSNNNLTQSEMSAIISDILNGGSTDAQIGAFLIALSIKGETVDEVILCQAPSAPVGLTAAWHAPENVDNKIAPS